MSTALVSRATLIEFTVLGRPRPQGSKRHVGNGVLVESSKGLKPWRQEVAGTAIATFPTPVRNGVREPLFGPHVPLEITLNFYFSKPKSAKRRGMTTKPDVDKLGRAIMDSLKGILFYDDSQVIEAHIRKHYGGPERVEIRLQEAI